MDGVRFVLGTEHMADAYWTDALACVPFKYNMLGHIGTVRCPYTDCTGDRHKLRKLWVFVQTGWIPNLSHKTKLNDRGRLALYRGIKDAKHIILLAKSGLDTKVRLTYLHTVHKNSDPTLNSHNSYVEYKQKVRFIPEYIKIGTPPRLQLQKKIQYPDADRWSTAHY